MNYQPSPVPSALAKTTPVPSGFGTISTTHKRKPSDALLALQARQQAILHTMCSAYPRPGAWALETSDYPLSLVKSTHLLAVLLCCSLIYIYETRMFLVTLLVFGRR